MINDIYKPPSSELYDHAEIVEEEKSEQIKVLASGFRTVLYGIYFLLASIAFMAVGGNMAAMVLVVVGAGVFAFGVILIGIGEKNSILLGLTYLLFCAIPILNIALLAVILKRAARVLKTNAYKIKVWGPQKMKNMEIQGA
jgi:lipopolysaccharide export LptBFGC system permease protein LptF